jgi:hypothetical protein
MTERTTGWQVSDETKRGENPEVDGSPIQGPPNKIYGINRSTAMMGLMFLGGLTWVFFASRQFTPVEMSEEDRKNQTYIDAGLQNMMKISSGKEKHREKMRGMIRSIYFEAKNRQIPMDELKHNPFVFEPAVAKAPKPEPVKTRPVDTPKRKPEDDKPPEPVEQPPPIDGLRLQSVLLGNPASAMISGSMVNEGQTLQGWKIVKIEASRVVLQWKDRQYVLRMP